MTDRRPLLLITQWSFSAWLSERFKSDANRSTTALASYQKQKLSILIWQSIWSVSLAGVKLLWHLFSLVPTFLFPNRSLHKILLECVLPNWLLSWGVSAASSLYQKLWSRKPFNPSLTSHSERLHWREKLNGWRGRGNSKMQLWRKTKRH